MIQIGPALVPRQGGAAGGGGSAPVNSVLPGVAGAAVQGETLTATPGTWSGSPAPAFAFQWRRGGTAIAGATGTSLVLAAADVGAVITVTVTATSSAGSAAATSAPTGPVTAAAAPASLPVTPAARWHPGFSTVTESAGRVVSASDLQGLAGLTEGGPGLGPRALTDAQGRRFWRFEGAQFLNVAGTLAGLSNRAVAVFMVGRAHRAAALNPMFSLGNVAAGTTVNTAGPSLDAATLSSSAPFLRSHARAGSLDAANGMWMVPGSQMQVLGAVSRTTANGGTRLWLNGRFADAGQNTVLASSATGAEIGRHAFNPGASGNWGQFDLYEMIVYSTGLTNAEGQAVADALVAAYAIPAVTNQLVLEGDSITQGTGLVIGGASGGMVLSEPGAGRLPAGWRVVNMGTAGATVATLTTRRDAANGWASMTLPGQNVVAFEIGRNDFGTAAAHYANVTAWLNTATTGVLQRGWTVRQMANIASSSVLQPQIEAYRALIRNAQYLTDTQTNAGGAFAGRLSVVSTDLIEDGPGNPVFLTSTDAADTTYYVGDNTHPTVLGALLRITGGSTPAYAVAAGLA